MGAKLRVATVGTGYFSQFHYAAWRRLADAGDVELVALCNRSRGSGEEFSRRYRIPLVFDDLQTMLSETGLDLLDVITPPITHPEYIRLAMDHDVAAICQKPFTPSLVEAESLVEYIGQRNGTVIIHENFRFQPWYGKLRELIDGGKIGEPYEVAFKLRPGDGQGPQAYLDRQPYFQQMERFLVHETAIHLIDTFRYLFGEMRSVYAELKRLNPVIAGEDAGIILFQFANGRRGLFDGNRLVDHKAENRRLTMGEMCIEGSAGTLTLDGDGVIRWRGHGTNAWQELEYDWDNRDFGGDCVYRVQRHVVDHLMRGTTVVNTAQEYLQDLRIEEAVYRSATSGQRVDL